MFHKITNSFLSFLRILEPESWVYVVFILLSMNIGTLRPYLLAMVLLVVVIYFLNKELINSVWLGFIGIYLLRQSKYFIKPYIAPDNYSALGLKQPELIFFVAFADALLILLLYLLVRSRFKTGSKPFKIPHAFPYLPLLLIITLGVVSSLLSPLPEVSWFWLLQLTKLFAMGFLAMALVKDKSLAKKTLEIIFIYGLFLASLVVAQKINGGPIGLAIEEKYTGYAGRFADESPSLYRPGGIFWDANLTSSILIMFLPSWFIFSFKKVWFHRGFMMSCFVVGSLALILTASRAAWVIGAMLILVSYQLIIKKNKVQLPVWLKKYGWIILGLLIIFLAPMILDRLMSLTQVFREDGGAIYRLRHLQMAAHFMATRPLGLGLNVYQYKILDQWKPEFYLYDSTPAHNLFAQVGAALGIGGLLLFIRFIYRIIVQGYSWLVSGKNILIKGLILGCLGYLLVSQFYPWWLTIPISGIVWLLLGIAYAQS
ncbi:O-antigen ligase family protein [Patescibacteria group bacterium]|nr:O-antigen ligase family protein [Patescibacteria group bacterium]MBU1967006.1 O-antigen ligase family protein [Patescibacteria group bacterium]MBU2543428.1 O-antigen ligase family protein [Patescibacteria group bacterium]